MLSSTLFQRSALALAVGTSLLLNACSDSQPESTEPLASEEAPVTEPTPKAKKLPSEIIDLTNWYITVPVDLDNNLRADNIHNPELKEYQLDNFFYVDENDHVVFATPNKAITTPNSTNSRSELRHLVSGDPKMSTKDPKNNFVLASHPNAAAYGSVGGRLEATLKVDHVPLNAKYGEKPPADSVVVGQIHAGKDEELKKEGKGFGWGNEPLKIFYKKFPHHETGSVFWNYERNLVKEDPNRIDIDYAVWGYGWESQEDPGEAGIALGETFSYVVNVEGDIMYLEFSAENRPTVKHQINLADNVDANGNVDEFDEKEGYLKDWMYFKAGAYDQCSTKDDPNFRYPACPGTGDWETDKANGDYTSVTFSKISLSAPTPVE